jgi:hypothetical protein
MKTKMVKKGKDKVKMRGGLEKEYSSLRLRFGTIKSKYKFDIEPVIFRGLNVGVLVSIRNIKIYNEYLGDSELKNNKYSSSSFKKEYSSLRLKNLKFYLSPRLKFIHLFRKNNSYPVAVSLVQKFYRQGVSYIVIMEKSQGFLFFLFRIEDYLKAVTIQYKDYEKQYAPSLVYALEVFRDFDDMVFWILKNEKK